MLLRKAHDFRENGWNKNFNSLNKNAFTVLRIYVNTFNNFIQETIFWWAERETDTNVHQDQCFKIGIWIVNYIKRCLSFQYWFGGAWNWTRSILPNQFTRLYDSRWVSKQLREIKGH